MTFSMKPKKVSVEPNSHPDSEIIALIDLDYVKYTIAGAGEDRSIKIIHKASGKEVLKPVKIEDPDNPDKTIVEKIAFKNRTEFWGRTKKKISGWLGDLNEQREKKNQSTFSKEDFEIEDIQKPEPIQNVIHSAKKMILRDLDNLGTDKYEAYYGKGDSFRLGLSTLKEYKGNRKDQLKPLLLEEVTSYLAEKFNGKKIEGLEADDELVKRAYGNPNCVILGEDKDYRGQPVKFFDVNRPDEGIINGDCFGRLWIQGTGTKEKILGRGRLFLYYQMLSEDQSDNYKANSHSDIKWGCKSAYKALCECKNDKEAWEVLIDSFKELYPEPKVITSWQGHEILIDWMYILKEMWEMARMKRFDNDFYSVHDALLKYEVEYTYG